ncbi:MAG: T9SS type A sorting domain-containing protein [candidate division WOR-3 bacterium]|nr:MAG: T9SS type A sorting domain-containing protein [candidate division WOR-3 bacterium]
MKKSFAACLFALPVLALAAPADLLPVELEFFLYPILYADSGVPLIPGAGATNYGSLPVVADAHLHIGPAYTDTALVSLAGGSSMTVAFDTWLPVIRGHKTIACSLVLAGEDTAFLRLCDTTFVVVCDIGIDTMYRQGGCTYVVVHNYGNVHSSVVVTLNLEDSLHGLRYSDRISLFLDEGDVQTVVFPFYDSPPPVLWYYCASLSADMRMENNYDTLVVGAHIQDVPVGGPGAQPLRLVPAPGGFVLYGPAEALDHVLVFDPTGRMLATTRRRESDRLQVSGLGPGVYIVSAGDFRHKLVLAR